MDWKKLIAELIDSGMTQTAIGEHIGVSQSAIAQVVSDKLGSQRGFKWEPGQKLIELHKSKVAEGAATTQQAAA